MPRYSNRHFNRIADNVANELMLMREEQQQSSDENGGNVENGEDDLEMEWDEGGSIFNGNITSSDDTNSEMEGGFEDEHDIFIPSSDDDEQVQPPQNANKEFMDKLRVWKSQHGIKMRAVSDLLKILRVCPGLEFLPKDCRTLMKTPRSTEIREIEPGQYAHFGISKGVAKVLKEFRIQDSITLNVNVDGIPLYGSSNIQCWAIQGHVKECPLSSPFFIGIWEGRGKPKDFNEFLKDFVNEAREMYENGINFQDRHFAFTIGSFSCDAPARAAMAGIKGHNAYHGCGKCKQKGKTCHERFLKITSHINIYVIYTTENQFKSRSDFWISFCLNFQCDSIPIIIVVKRSAVISDRVSKI